MTRLPPLALLFALAARAAAQDGSFENQFPAMTISAGQAAAVAGTGVAAGAASAAAATSAGTGAPAYVNPTSLQSATRPDQTKPKANENQSNNSNGNQTPQMPQIPSGGSGNKSGSGSGSGSGGGGCKSCQQGLQKSIDKAKTDLSNANTNDPHTKALLDQANKSISNAQGAHDDLDKANAELQKAHDALSKAADNIKTQNSQNKENIDKLDRAQTDRDNFITQMQADGTTKPDCTGTPPQPQYGTPSGTALQNSLNQITGAQTDENTAGGLVRSIAGVAEQIISIGRALGAADATAQSNLGAAPTMPTTGLLDDVAAKAKASQAASNSAVDKAKAAQSQTQYAHDMSERVKDTIDSTNAQARAADTIANTACTRLKTLGQQWQTLTDAGQTAAAQAIAAQAPAIKQQAKQTSDPIKSTIKQLQDAQTQAEHQLDTSARDAIRGLQTALSGSGR